MDSNSKNYFAQTWQLIQLLHNSNGERDNFVRELERPGNISKVYRGIPIKRHFSILGSVDPEFKKFTTLDTAGNQTTVRSISKLSAEQILETLLNFYEDNKAVDELTKKAAIETHLLTDNEKKEPDRAVDEDKKIEDRDQKIKEKEETSGEQTVKSVENQFKQENPIVREEIPSASIPTGRLNNFNSSNQATAPSAVLNSTTTNVSNTARNIASSAQIGARNIGGDVARGAKSWVNEAVEGITGVSPTENVSASFESSESIESPVPAYVRRQVPNSFEVDEPIETEIPPVFRDIENNNQDDDQPRQRMSRQDIRQLQEQFKQAETETIQYPRPQSSNISGRGLFNRNVQVPESMKNFGSSAQIRVNQGVRAVGRGGGSFLQDLGGGFRQMLGFGGRGAAMGAAEAGVAGGALAGGTAAVGGTAAATGAAVAATPVLVVIGIIIGIILLFFGLFWFINYLTETNALFPPYRQTLVSDSTGPTGPDNPADNSCTYTQATDNNLTIKSSILLGWINETAARYNIPGSVLASMAVHETPSFVTKVTNDSQEIKSNRYCGTGSEEIFCVNTSNQRAHGGACTALEIRSGFKTAQAQGVMQVLNIYNPGVDLCNIQQNIDAGAKTLSEKLPAGSSFTSEENVKKAVCGYFGVNGTTCKYTANNDYASEVWGDYQRCLAQTPSPTPNPSLEPGQTPTPTQVPQPPGSFVFYCQSASPWGSECVINKPGCKQRVWGNPPTTCTYAQAACGPTSFAMVASSLGVSLNPIQAANQFVTANTFTCEAGTTGMLSFYNTQFFKNRFIAGPDVVTGGALNMQKAKATFDAGYKYLIGSAGQFPLSGGGRFDHIFVVESIDMASNEVIVRDPDKCSGSGVRRFKPDQFNWKYAHGIKLK